MADPVIRVEGLSKKYRLGMARHDTLRDRIVHGFRGLLSSAPRRNDAENEFWALRDVSFSVAQGEVVGIVGRNGAGKSTLLKILSRITDPTAGRISIRGRVASLLEVGTGFHPELTGRENIFLNGAILGMSRAEIRRKFDEIVAFAEVERFLDTPVKHYSSGMYVRLAFAVAAHLEPEILIVDEVLAVGDAAFQKKCLGKMNAVARDEGRTVLFVSHNLQSVRQLCRTALLMANGQVRAQGKASEILDAYARGLVQPASRGSLAPAKELLDRAYVLSAAVESAQGTAVPELLVGETWRVRVRFRVARSYRDLVVAVGFVSADGTPVQTAWHPPTETAPGDYEAIFEQSRVILEAGHYSVMVGLSEGDRSIQQLEAASLDISGESVKGFFGATAGVGTVLNSMRTELKRT